MPETDRNQGRPDLANQSNRPIMDPDGRMGRTDAPYTEGATGAESTYVHGGQRALENPPRQGASDVSLPVQDELNEMHVDSKLQSGQAVKPAALPTEKDEFGRTPEQMKELNAKREESFKKQDAAADARKNHTDAVTEGQNAVRDRTLAVQEEVATRERDGAMPGTPAFERRKARLKEIVGETEGHEEADQSNHADRLQVIAASLHAMTPGGIEQAQHDLMALAAEMRGDKDGAKAADERKKAADAKFRDDQDQHKAVA